MRQSSIALAAVASFTLFDIARATTNALSDRPSAVDDCFSQAGAGGAINAGKLADVRILTKDEAETFRSHREFGCADNPTSTIYV